MYIIYEMTFSTWRRGDQSLIVCLVTKTKKYVRTAGVHVSTAILKLAEGTIDLVKSTHGLMNTRACRKSVPLSKTRID